MLYILELPNNLHESKPLNVIVWHTSSLLLLLILPFGLYNMKQPSTILAQNLTIPKIYKEDTMTHFLKVSILSSDIIPLFLLRVFSPFSG
jgi:hypothetical protein